MLAIDAGTSGVTVLLIDHTTKVILKEYAELQQYYPEPGWVEHDPEELLLKTKQLLTNILTQISPNDVAGIGITNQRETVVVWNKYTGKSIHPAIVWQCRRTAARCKELQVHTALIKQKTGLVLDAYFSATKIEWLLQHTNEKKEDLLAGTIDSWLVWHLSLEHAHVTDTSNASRTMLYNIHTLSWDQDLLTLFHIPQIILPEVKQSSEIYGNFLFHEVSIPLAGIAGDQQAALFGQCCFSQGMSKNTYGTGCFIMLHTGQQPVSSEKLLTTIAWTTNKKTIYALEGSIFIAGAAVQWLRDGLHLIRDAKETAALAHSLSDNEHIYFVPALSGLGCPYWDPDARGMLIGMTRGTTSAHIARATLEAIAYQTRDVLETMKQQAQFPITCLRADGGAAANDFLMQFQADILDIPVLVSSHKETTALGAAFLAGLAVGFWKSQEEIQSFSCDGVTYTPRIDSHTREKLYSQWKDAVQRCYSWNKS